MAGDVEGFVFLFLEMRDLNKLTSKLELCRRECLILVNISMFCNRCKNLLAEIYLHPFEYNCIASEISKNNYHDI